VSKSACLRRCNRPTDMNEWRPNQRWTSLIFMPYELNDTFFIFDLE
jgi:hypothetical protein